MNEKFPIKMVIKDRERNLIKAVTSVEMIKEETDIRIGLIFIETDYISLVSRIRMIKETIDEQKKIDPRLYWLIGETILIFLRHLDEMGFYLLHQNKTFARDTGISESSIEKILIFIRRFNELGEINPEISWNKYRSNKI